MEVEYEMSERHACRLVGLGRFEIESGEGNRMCGARFLVKINARVLEYETLISLAQLKLHETATVTLSLKNIAMSFPAADYSAIHATVKSDRTSSSRTCTPSLLRWPSAFTLISRLSWDTRHDRQRTAWRIPR